MRKHWHKAAVALAALVVTLTVTGSVAASADPVETAGRPGDLAAFARILDAQADAWFAEDGAGFAGEVGDVQPVAFEACFSRNDLMRELGQPEAFRHFARAGMLAAR